MEGLERKGERMIRIKLDGKERVMQEGITVMDFIKYLSLDPKRSILQLNSIILEKALYNTKTLKEGDELNIIPITGGG